MNELFKREIELTVGSKSFASDDFTIYFDVPFSDSEEPNIGEINIYNLKDSTINEIKKTSNVILNAGYEGDVGAILLGEVKKSFAEWDSVDKITTIDALDGSERWLSEPVKRTYKPGITAEQVLNDLLNATGLEIGAFSLPDNKVYHGGKTVNGRLSNAIASIVRDCGAKTHVNRGKIFIRPRSDGDSIGFVLNKERGLISSPTPTEKEVKTGGKDQNGMPIRETVKGWDVKCLLNHRITTDSILIIESKTANGTFRVESGVHKHDGRDFVTEMEVYPL